MAVYGVDKTIERRVFKTWEEKRKPSGIIEVTSRKTKKEDQKDKFLIYRDILKVKEYFLFDPFGEYLKQALIGYRLHAGEYVRIEEIDGRVPSKVFNLHLQRNGLALTNSGHPEKSSLAANAMSAQRVEAEREYEFERYRREIAERNAGFSTAKERQLPEREVERLRRELEATKQPKAD